MFPKLYEICDDQDCLVSDCYANDEWVLKFKRSFGVEGNVQWEEMLDLVRPTVLNSEPDKVTWTFEKSGVYTTKSMYGFPVPQIEGW
jgi:hypothetical protein